MICNNNDCGPQVCAMCLNHLKPPKLLWESGDLSFQKVGNMDFDDEFPFLFLGEIHFPMGFRMDELWRCWFDTRNHRPPGPLA